MDALEQLSQYRHVDPVDDRIVAAAVDTITAALAGGPKPRTASRPLRRRRRTAIATGGVLAAVAAGCGIAAAAGVFYPPKPPSGALVFSSSTDPAKVPGATLQLSISGPEGITFQVVTYSVTTESQSASCVALGIIEPDGQPDTTHGNAGCSGMSAPTGETIPAPPALQQVTPSSDLEIWSAPSGASYYLIYGRGSPGVAEVALTNRDGVAAARQPANPNGYVIYIPAASFTSYSHLVFTDKSGQIVFTENMN